jgi:hypothetical protein
MNLRRLNEAGIERFSKFLDSLTTTSPQPYPVDILDDSAVTELVEPNVDIELREFDTRIDAGEYLNAKLGEAGIANVERDRGLWAWLAFLYFDQLCPRDKAGQYKPRERARWIPSGDFRKYYRHLLAGPFRIFRAHRDAPERAAVLLCGPLDTPGEIAEQIASRQEYVTNKAVVEAAKQLYLDPATGRPKRGSGGKSAGTPRRLADVLNQFDVTWDLFALTAR